MKQLQLIQKSDKMARCRDLRYVGWAMCKISDNKLVTEILDSFPSPAMIVDGDVRILYSNFEALKLLDKRQVDVLEQKTGDVFKCLNGMSVPNGCGTSCLCGECTIRTGVTSALEDEGIYRKKMELFTINKDMETNKYVLSITTKPFNYEDQKLVLLVMEDISELTALRGLMPICQRCKKKREDDLYWSEVTKHLKKISPTDYSHGICPDCRKILSDDK